ncbi:MAG: DNA-3-methyladenine glycosylase 2 family protein [Clostridiales bacterium]|nr:DNA-3-methyladenine glycosylase 2 family protein [Clostridiales bacterium]
MVVEYLPQGILVRDAGWLALEPTLNSGQCFRFSQREDGAWAGVAGRRPVVLRETEEGLLFEETTIGDFEGFWRFYFDLDRDYGAVEASFPQDERLRGCLRFAAGVRILRQEGFEALLSFILSQNNNLPRIRGIVERLCRLFGEPIRGGDFYAFPAPERLAALKEEELAPLRAGWRAAYLLDASQRVASGEVDLAEIAALPLSQARERLQVIRGVGPKVAECVLLYGLGRLEAFPLDVWMKRAMACLFPGWTPEDFGPCAGVAQQAIFHYCRCHPEQVAGAVPG